MNNALVWSNIQAGYKADPSTQEMALVDANGVTHLPNMSNQFGHIILCHDLYSVCTVDLIPNIIQLFTQGGYTFVDLPTCIGVPRYQ